jgi:predicted NBD/HSP70 family sugar kinase
MPAYRKQMARQKVAIGNNPERSRTHNRRVVLEVVRMHGPLGRTRIAKLAQLTPQAVANIVDELMSENLLMELGRLRSGRGQPPIQFAVNPDGAMTIGVEIAADHIVTVVLDLSGKVLAQSMISASDTDPEHIVPALLAELDKVQKRAEVSASKLLGVGVVMPGPFGIDGMTSVGPTTLPGWNAVDAVQLLRDASGEDVIVENDATAAAVGERLFGVGRRISNFCMVYFGAGVGLGIISEGRPFRGAFGNAGEIGHVVVAPGGRPCPCGRHGCLERYASLHALREKLTGAGLAALGFADLEALHARREPVLMGWIGEAAAHLAPVIATLENIIDPETIVFGGALPNAIIDDIIDAMNALPISVASRRTRTLPRVLRGQTGQLTAALGAAALPLLETVTPKLDTSAAPVIANLK